MENLQLNDVQFKEYLSKEWLNHKDHWSKGASVEELQSYTKPTIGDLECLVDYMIDGLSGKEYQEMFHLRLNQAKRVFSY